VRGELRRLVKLDPLPPFVADSGARPRLSAYCRLAGAVKRLVLPDSAHAAQAPGRTQPPRTATSAPFTSQQTATASVSAYQQRLRAARQRAAIYQVEIQKKLAISAACVIFALLGVPLAVRFPRGGVGLVIGTSLAVFSVYYVGLIGGEELGDRLIVPPFFAMWTPNLIFLAVSFPLMWAVRRAGSTSHGGDWDEVKDWLFGWTKKLRIVDFGLRD
jgi:lipopolysaccharide export system permease protein